MPEFTAIACPACSLVCDDLVVRVDGASIVPVGHACPRAVEFLRRATQSHPPAAAVHGSAVAVDQALDQAAAILKTSRAPLVWGLSGSAVPGQRAAVHLADVLGASLDTAAGVGHAAGTLAFQRFGESACTLGEVRDRADLILFWECDPVTSHPRLLDRFVETGPGRFLKQGRGDRIVVTIRERPSRTVAHADQIIEAPRERQIELITALRQLVRGQPQRLRSLDWISPDVLEDLAGKLKQCRYIAIFHGLGHPETPHDRLALEQLARLVAELNGITRCTARELGPTRHGADSVVAWQTGYPFAVNFARGYPRYSPSEFTAPALLERGDVDGCVILGSELTEHLSPQALQVLQQIPTIVLDPPGTALPWTPTVQFTVAAYGVFAAGTTTRLDDVALPLRQLADGVYPTDVAILDQLRERVSLASSAADRQPSAGKQEQIDGR